MRTFGYISGIVVLLLVLYFYYYRGPDREEPPEELRPEEDHDPMKLEDIRKDDWQPQKKAADPRDLGSPTL